MNETSLINEIKARIGQRRPQTSHLNIRNTYWDRLLWKDIRALTTIDEGVTDLYDGKVGKRPPFLNAPELLQDMTFALHQTLPRMEEVERVFRSAALYRPLLRGLMDSPFYEELHHQTCNDPLMTAIALEAFIDLIRDLLEQGAAGASPEAVEVLEMVEAANAARGAESADSDGNEEGEGGQGDDEGEGGQGDSENESDGEGEQPSPRLTGAIDKAAYDVREQLSEARRTANGFDFSFADWRQMSAEERLRLIDAFRSEAMRRLAARVGAVRRFAFGVRRTKVLDEPMEMRGIETGRALRRLLKSQLALLARPDTRYLFARRFLEGTLFQFERFGEEDAGYGPMVVCIDHSASMTGDKMDYAIAVAEALRRFAAEDQRNYHAIFFSSSVSRCFDWPGATPTSVSELLAYLQVKPGGGTDFQRPLQEAIELVEREYIDEGRAQADIVFITDGIAQVPPGWLREFNEHRAEMECQVHGVFVTGARDVRDVTSATRVLASFSDYVVQVHDLVPAEMARIFLAA